MFAKVSCTDCPEASGIVLSALAAQTRRFDKVAKDQGKALRPLGTSNSRRATKRTNTRTSIQCQSQRKDHASRRQHGSALARGPGMD
jgi:hypothetical protein